MAVTPGAISLPHSNWLHPWHSGPRPTGILKPRLHALRCLSHLGIVHPEGLGRWHHDLRVWIDSGPVLQAQPADVIAVEMADEDGVYPCGVEAGCAQVRQSESGRRRSHVTQSGIDQNGLPSGPENHRREGVLIRVRRHEGFLGRLPDLGDVGVPDEILERPRRRPIMDGGDLDVADLVAIETGCLPAAR